MYDKITLAMLSALSAAARRVSDGHFTVMRFTTEYRVCLGTPEDRDDVEKMFCAETMPGAISLCLAALAARAKMEEPDNAP